MTYQLPEIEKKADYVQHKFNEIAPQYDLFNDLITFGFHRYWKRFVVRQAALAYNGICLDLCCGTGDIAQRLKECVPEGHVYALDFSRGMLRVAQKRKSSLPKNIVFLQGDALALPFPDEYFDAVTVGYGLRNVKDLDQGIREILRVLKSGGVLVSLDVGKVRIPLVYELSQFHFFHIVPWLGKRLSPNQDMFDYLPHSAIDYPNQERLKKYLLLSGFKQVDIFDFFLGASTVHTAYKP